MSEEGPLCRSDALFFLVLGLFATAFVSAILGKILLPDLVPPVRLIDVTVLGILLTVGIAIFLIGCAIVLLAGKD